MAQTKKKSSRKNTKSSKRKNSKKAYIPANSIIVMCAVVIGICTALLLFSTAMDSGGKIGSSKKTPVAVEKQQESTVSKKPVNKSVQKPAQKSVSKTSSSSDKSSSEIKKTEVTKQTSAEASKTSSSKNTSSVSAVKPVEKSVSVNTTPVPSVPVTPSKPSAVSDIPALPAAVNGAKLVIIFDDGGQNMKQLEKCVTLPFPVTVAVLPRLIHSKEAADRVRSSGNEVMLHQPMQAVNLNVNPGAGAITPDMTEDQVRSVLFQNINEVGPIAGLNNHEGSLITADAEKMSYVMKVCSDYGIWFLDSRTNVNTQVPYVAGALGYSYYERNIFLDNQKTRQNIINEFVKGLNFANRNGVAIMIGHVWSADILPGVLKELYPLAVAKGYKFTTVSASGALKR